MTTTNVTDFIEDNLSLSSTPEKVDQVNASFYSRFPYPWKVRSIDCIADPDFARVMLNQNLGDWTHQMVPPNPHIWVAGCGTNQAAIAALHFPTASVRGSDVSDASLEACAATAQELGCTNLELRRESINQAAYSDSFDYIICTGVIHHNADPESTLKQLARALKPAGVLELMVYNRYHRILTSAFQKAVRLIAGTESRPDFQKEFSMTRKLIDNCPGDGLVQRFVSTFRQAPDAQIADSLLQPVENSYTVETLEAMAHRCGLEFLTPTPNAWDVGKRPVNWNLRFSAPEIQKCYDKFSDSRRWQITNLLLCENSPMLWFYLKRTDSPLPRKSEQQICDSFMETCFRPNAVTRHCYVLNKDEKFTRTTSALPYPGMPARPELRRIVEASHGNAPMGRILESLNAPRDLFTMNDIRLGLTTSAYPHLRSIPA